MAENWGSQHVSLFVDGLPLSSSRVKGARVKASSKMENVTSLGDAYDEFLPAGMASVEFTQTGALFDGTTNASHDIFKAPSANTQGAVRIVTLVVAGQTKGNEFVGFEGAFTPEYEPIYETGTITKVNATYAITGAVNWGVLLQELAAKTASYNTKTQGLEIDGGAATTTGWSGYLQVTAFSGFSGVAVKFRDSADNSSYADLSGGAFTSIAAVGAQRIAGAAGATVRRYTCIDVVVTGSGSLTLLVGLSRT